MWLFSPGLNQAINEEGLHLAGQRSLHLNSSLSLLAERLMSPQRYRRRSTLYGDRLGVGCFSHAASEVTLKLPPRPRYSLKLPVHLLRIIAVR